MKKSLVIISAFTFLISMQLYGQTWSKLIRLTWNAGESYSPSIATDSGSGIHLVFWDNTPGNYEVFYRRSTDGGITWDGRKQLTWTGGNSDGATIASDSGNGIHVVWHDYTPGNSEIFYKCSTDGGGTWPGPTRLTWNGWFSIASSIAIDSGNGVHVAWYRGITWSNYEIFYKNHK